MKKLWKIPRYGLRIGQQAIIFKCMDQYDFAKRHDPTIFGFQIMARAVP